jgi:hypothetical protein
MRMINPLIAVYPCVIIILGHDGWMSRGNAGNGSEDLSGSDQADQQITDK